MKEIFQQNQNLTLSIAIIALCLIVSILYLIAFKAMRDRIELQEKLIELKDERIEIKDKTIEVLKEQIDEQDKIIKEYQKMTDLMTAKGSNDGTK